jgi:hypothetical protein
MQDNHSHPIAAESAAPTALSSHVRRPRIYLRLEDLFPSLSLEARRRRLLAVGIGILAVTVTVGLFLWQRADTLAPPPVGDGGAAGGAPTQTQETDETPYGSDLPTEEGDPADTSAPKDPPEETVEETATGEATDEVTTPADGETTNEEAVTGAEEVTTAPAETEAPIPEGCLGFTRTDVSESALGVGHVTSSSHTLPTIPSVDALWEEVAPAVLLVNTRPYEGYGGGAAWYDPSAGGLALTETPNAPDGVVALGAALARDLRERGITVIHLRIPVSAEDSSAEILSRTEAAIRDYCRLYPRIGAVLDLRRTAELTADGRILATQGYYDGAPCAQVGVSVSGGRDGEAAGLDLMLAQSLRESLWAVEPTLTRPTRVRNGQGLAGDLPDLRVLTLEIGSAGNTYGEACATVEPLGEAIAAVLEKYS